MADKSIDTGTYSTIILRSFLVQAGGELEIHKKLLADVNVYIIKLRTHRKGRWTNELWRGFTGHIETERNIESTEEDWYRFLSIALLSYLQIGVDPTTGSWGNMINSARMELAREPVVWWNLAAAFVFMFGLVLPANLFGDAVRDALDPRLRTE